MYTKKRSFLFFPFLYILLGLGIAAAGTYLALSSRDAAPVLVKEPEAAHVQVETMLGALCQGQYDTLSACLYGTPDLGLDREADSEVGKIIWEAFADSFTYTLGENFRVTDRGVAVDVSITCLVMESVTENLRTRSEKLLEERVAQAKDPSEVYDENNEYREEVVMEVLQTAARDALKEDTRQITRELELNLIYENGQWWIMPEAELLEAISGGLLG